jgi:hypothetical protein
MPTASTSEIGCSEAAHPAYGYGGKFTRKVPCGEAIPHLILDGLFSDEAMEELLYDIPSLRDDRWVHHEEKRLTKSNLRSAVDLGEIGYQHLSFLHSAAFFICWRS